MCQAPPGAQQLRLPLLNLPHLGHIPLAVVLIMVAVGVTVVVSGAAVATVVLATVVTGGGKSAGVDKL